MGDVVGINERLSHGSDRQGHFTSQDRFEEEALTEVLAEEAATENRPFRAGSLQCFLGPFRFHFTASCEKDQSLHAFSHRKIKE